MAHSRQGKWRAAICGAAKARKIDPWDLLLQSDTADAGFPIYIRRTPAHARYAEHDGPSRRIAPTIRIRQDRALRVPGKRFHSVMTV